MTKSDPDLRMLLAVCALDQTAVFLRYKREASFQSTPQAKLGPWKWDLCGSQLIIAPIEVSPRFYTGKAQQVPTRWAIRRSEWLWNATLECLSERHFDLVQPGHLAKNSLTGLLIRGYQETANGHFGELNSLYFGSGATWEFINESLWLHLVRSLLQESLVNRCDVFSLETGHCHWNGILKACSVPNVAKYSLL